MSDFRACANTDAALSPTPPHPDQPVPEPQPAAGEPFRPTYAAAFQCIGAACEDHCCQGWAIPLDRKTYDRYQQFPPEKLGSLVSQHVSINAAAHAPPSHFAQIVPTSTGACPFFDADRLCAIHKQYGGQLLSTTCSAYPRTLNKVNGVLEGSLLLSCPEAARNVLLVPDFPQSAGDLSKGDFRTDYVVQLGSASGTSTRKPYGEFHAVRALLIAMVKDRSRPLWQRLLLIGSVCKRLDEVSTAEGDEAVPAILADHRQVLEQGLLRNELESWPSHLQLKLNIFLRLTEERARDATTGRRFQESFWWFVEGIGSAQDATAGSDIGRYLEAYGKYYLPFFQERPFILENFLLNYIFQNLFPFGRENTIRSTPRSIFNEYILLATQFAWIDTLLTGAAGSFQEAFAETHVVHVIQSFCRAVEHSPYVLISMNELMTHLQMDNLQGMAVLLRN